jgi:hypothetical protein
VLHEIEIFVFLLQMEKFVYADTMQVCAKTRFLALALSTEGEQEQDEGSEISLVKKYRFRRYFSLHKNWLMLYLLFSKE